MPKLNLQSAIKIIKCTILGLANGFGVQYITIIDLQWVWVPVNGKRDKVIFADLSNVEPIRLLENGIDSISAAPDYGQFHLLIWEADIISPKVKMK